MKEIITIQVSKFLNNELVEQIAQKQWHSTDPVFVNRSRQYVFDEITDENDCFGVVALTTKNEVVGRLHCVRNKENIKRWYYGDLFVIPEYRRMGIATQMIKAAKNQLSEMGAENLCCYVEPNNIASRQLQLAVGFEEKPFRKFNTFSNEGQIMYEVQIKEHFCVIPATVDDAYFVRILFVQNKKELNIGNISLDQWKEKLSKKEDNKKHCLICKGAIPIAYMELVKNEETSKNQISMFFVAKGFSHEQIYKFAENISKEMGTTIEITNDPSVEVLQAIAHRHGEIADKVLRGLNSIIQRAKSTTGYFAVILKNGAGEVIGFADFIQSSREPTKWLYTDLWVAPEHRCLGNAKAMVTAGCEYLSKIGGKTLLCTVDSENMPSLKTQRALGFREVENQPFEFFETSGLLMFEKTL